MDSVELNSWRRGFTPQAEIWNGRLAMLGLSAGLAFLLIRLLMADALPGYWPCVIVVVNARACALLIVNGGSPVAVE